MLVNPKGRRLREILRATGLNTRPSISNEAEYLIATLSDAQLASVGLLVDLVLTRSHVVSHLPDAQAFDAIRQDMELKEAQQ